MNFQSGVRSSERMGRVKRNMLPNTTIPLIFLGRCILKRRKSRNHEQKN
uniref:Uncharacterized protein n=1 Tax=Arundo donax TaxID=35708 RepID=A0A0A8ZFQ0_ARUDO